MPKLTQDQARYVYRYWTDLRAANRKADEFSAKWNVMNDEFNDWCKLVGVVDPVQYAKVKAENLELRDLFNAYTFWRDESRRLHDAIHGEYLATLMLLGGQGWEPPARY